MTNVRSLSVSASTASAAPAVSPAASAAAPAAARHPGRQRLRAVAPDEVPPVAELLHAGATWLPAPQHALPALPGQPPMVGYLVLVPADQSVAAGPGAPAVPVPGPVTPVTTGDELVRIDPEQRTAYVDGRLLDLTYLEFELLAHLVAHPHRVHTRDQLVTTVWGYGHVGDGRTVDVHVARLRRKLGADHRHSIVTVRRVGYKYVPSA
ncbi:winged helix-turn-helix domain-containing protein [Streptomyces sp. B1866]|uniref:winged helix-turn-helix domain-containing protein n=1 Tax=Streptomyces sp. B1866 TaxID=3075431 RepID=UPI00288D6B9D|nr:winged helix-turn-helix domain-containing protein [Streptomyces sp. B1866]MDT3396538.1 winged helix-turn-helix domain-containing protein [Streptomyces sp. B1866]